MILAYHQDEPQRLKLWRAKMKKLFVVTVLMIVVAMVSASSAGADILPYSSSLTWYGYQSSFLITPFDSSMGTLNSVTMSAEVHVEGSASIWASYTSSHGTDAILDGWTRFDEVPELGWGTTEARFSDGSGSVTPYDTYYRKDWGHFFDEGEPRSAVGYAGPTRIFGNFGRFEGTEYFDLNPDSELSVSNTPYYEMKGMEIDAGMYVIYEYDYTPRAVPEPSSLIALGALVTPLLAFRRRRA